MNYKILIPIVADKTEEKNRKGHLFESLVRKFLQQQNYEVQQRVREAGTEIDLLCRSKLTEEITIVECKAKSDKIDSSVVNKVFTDIHVFKAKYGWIFSVSDIGAEAKTRISKINESNGFEKIRFFAGNDLVNFLISAKEIREIEGEVSGNLNDIFLCVLDRQLIWIGCRFSGQGGKPVCLRAWDAENGKALDEEQLPDLSETDFPFRDVRWERELGQKPAGIRERHENEFQPVVEVIPGDEWSDYRPSNPTDFVGRSGFIHEISEYFDRVRDGRTLTRMFGIQGRSGWGKSSIALKLASEFVKKKILITVLDCRAAKLSIYADKSISKSFEKASKIFMPWPLFRFDGKFGLDPFEDQSVKEILYSAKSNGYIICVIFDQFEEIIHRKELKPTFDRLREIALATDEAQMQFVLGFSWKTDSSVSVEAPGYYFWHSLSDRRKDFIVDRFSSDDADVFIEHVEKSENKKLDKKIKRFILENYAGFPWLLKKLVRHFIFSPTKSGQRVRSGDVLDLKSLFESDLQDVTPRERMVIEAVAREAPAEYGSISTRFGESSVSSLIGKRLLINTGGMLNLYWDIFREYITQGEVPKVPNNYVPAVSVRRLRGAVRLICNKKQVDHREIAKTLGLRFSTAGNMIRDLENFGLGESISSSGTFLSNISGPVEATEKIVEFLHQHAVYFAAKEIIEEKGSANASEIRDHVGKYYSYIDLDKKTLDIYVRRMLNFLLELGVLVNDHSRFILGTPVRNLLDSASKAIPIRKDEVFRAAAPPQKVIEILEEISKRNIKTKNDAIRKGLRNALFAASGLDLIRYKGKEIHLSPEICRGEDFNAVVREFASSTAPFNNFDLKLHFETSSADSLGEAVSDTYGLTWSIGSCRRHGASFKVWWRWLECVPSLLGESR